jgi:lysophospholipase L1-like esterase
MPYDNPLTGQTYAATPYDVLDGRLDEPIGRDRLAAEVAADITSAYHDGRGVSAIGDSITQGDSTAFTMPGSGWFGRMLVNGDGRMRFVSNRAVSGARTDDVVSSQLPLVLADAPRYCIVLAGINDIISTYPFATTSANLTAIYESLLAAGITPIACTLLASSSGRAVEIDKRNLWIRHKADAYGLPLIDFHAVTVVPATNSINATYSDDNLHPNVAGATLMATTALDAVLSRFPTTPLPITQAKGDGVNVLTNGVFEGDANADGLADGWTLQTGGTGTVAFSIVDATGIIGKSQVMDVTAMTVGQSQSFYSVVTMGTGINVGDTVLFSGRFKAENTVSGGLLWYVRLEYGGADPDPFPLWEYKAVDTDDGWWSLMTTVPAGATNIIARVRVKDGTGTLTFSNVGILNLTTAGLA